MNELPKAIFLQTINRCNSRCVICPYKDTYKNLELEVMSLPLYERILDELTPLFKGHLGLYLHYEPLIDTRLPELIRIAKEYCPKSCVAISTNASLLDEYKAERLLDSPLDLITFNINGGKKETYEKMMPPLKWDVSINNIKNFLKKYKKKKYINFIKSNSNANEDKLLRDIFPDVQIKSQYWAINRGGSVEINKPKNTKNRFRSKVKKCIQPDINLNVLCNGDVLLCCNCWKKEVVLGNAKEDNIINIWNNNSLKHLNHDICRMCDIDK